MKRIILFLLALVAMAGHAKDVVIERPAFRSLMKNSFYNANIWPVKVELTKQATVVHFHVACASRGGLPLGAVGARMGAALKWMGSSLPFRRDAS